MRTYRRSIALASLLAVVVTGMAQAAITDRIEAGRARIKGWRSEPWPSAQRVRVVSTPMAVPMVVSTTPSGRVTYSSAFQAPAEEGATAESTVATPVMVVRPVTVIRSSSSGGGIPASLRHRFKGTYRNSR